MHNDRHCVKMILEYSQLLSTAHRILDGKVEIETRQVSDTFPTKRRKVKRWNLNDFRDNILYSATHINHPSAIWARSSVSNYMWLSQLLVELCKEYTFRYGKIHKCESIGLVNVLLNNIPNNIPKTEFTEPTPAMGSAYIIENDSLASYRNYYVRGKRHLASWKGKVNGRSIPTWFVEGCMDLIINPL